MPSLAGYLDVLSHAVTGAITYRRGYRRGDGRGYVRGVDDVLVLQRRGLLRRKKVRRAHRKGGA